MSVAQQKKHRASDPVRSVWVSANAGAGKTHVLADRVTRLLLGDTKPARILCLTYTKAAAAEMASRLFTQLGEWALLPDEKLIAELSRIGASEVGSEQLRKARQLFARALETPGGLKIQTIHSFCQHVLARFPVEANIPTRFHVLDERSANELMTAARNDVLARATAGESTLADAIGLLATRAPDMRFAEILNSATGSGRGKLRNLLEKYGSEEKLFAKVRATLGVTPGEDADTVVARFCKELGGERALCEKVLTWLTTGGDTDNELADSLGKFLAAGVLADGIAHLARVFLTAKGPRKSLATKPLQKAQPQLFEYMNALQQRFLDFDEKRKAAMVVTLTEALIKVASAVLESYERGKRARSALDYDDLTHHTFALLESRANAAWVLYKLDGGLDHILVDEAQDTSPEQWQIVAKLVEDFFSGSGSRESTKSLPTIFAVGDKKQSIFSFQGADPDAFATNLKAFENRAKEARMAFEPVELDVSYRGARDVLGFIDQVFADELARAGLTEAGGVIHHTPERMKVAGRIELWPAVKQPEEPEEAPQIGAALDTPAPDAAYKILAKRIADRIVRWTDARLVLPSTGRPVQPGDIMILVRRRGSFAEEMIRQLMDRGIAVAGADRMKLADQIAIADLVALGRFVLLPDDDLTLAALLKSPLVGISEDELFELAYERDGKLWLALVARREERPSFRSAYDFLLAALQHADLAPPFEFYSQILSRGARKALVARLGMEAADAIDEFLALALIYESAHPPSLEGFLDWFGRGASEVKRDMEQGGQAVRVMTVHGAKGLQAPVVIVPDTTQIPNEAAKAGLLYTGDCLYFGVNKNLETQPVTDAKTAAHEAEMREYRRLLYVALTRAQDWLVVCGYETKQKPPVNSLSWYRLAEAAARKIGREELDIGGEPIIAYGDSLAAFATGGTFTENGEPPLPDFLKSAVRAEKPNQRILQPSQAAGVEKPPVFSPFADQGYRFRRGLLVHSLLAALPDLPQDAREQAAMQFLTRRGIEEKNARALTVEALAVLNDPDFAPLFTPESRAEVPISVELPELGTGTRVSGQIDRLAVTTDTVLVADYKTNRPPPARVEDVSPLYAAQMALYRAALAKIYPGKRIECALVWTDGPRLMRLPDAVLDAEIAKITSRPQGLSMP